MRESRVWGASSLYQNSNSNFWIGLPHGEKGDMKNRGPEPEQRNEWNHLCELLMYKISPNTKEAPTVISICFLKENKAEKWERRGFLKRSFRIPNPPHPKSTIQNIEVFKVFASIEIQYMVWCENVMYRKTYSLAWLCIILHHCCWLSHYEKSDVIWKNWKDQENKKVRGWEKACRFQSTEMPINQC